MKQKSELKQKEQPVNRAGEVREELLNVYGEIGKLNANLSKLLHEAYKNAYYIEWGHDSFKDYVEDEIGLFTGCSFCFNSDFCFMSILSFVGIQLL